MDTLDSSPLEELRSGRVVIWGKFLSVVSKSFMLSVESVFEPLEPLFDAIVIIISCEDESILDFGFWIFDCGMEFQNLAVGAKHLDRKPWV